MDLGIQGKVAMVSAGSKGIGLAAARALAAEGCKVSLCSRNRESLDAALKDIPNAQGFVCDVASKSDLERWVADTVRELGEPDILVTNTGGPPAGALSAMTDEQWAAGFESTLMNVVRLVRLVAPGMVARNWGRIVHVTSLVAKEPAAILPISSTLRAGLMATTRLQALEYAPHGVTVNAVLPGHTLTDRQLHLANVRSEQLGITPEEALKRQEMEIPARRMGKPEEIGAAVAYLCSEPAAYITGVNLLVDGGVTKGLG
jgi:3-oxoacyl-[acyl-carrier protein] reductase